MGLSSFFRRLFGGGRMDHEAMRRKFEEHLEATGANGDAEDETPTRLRRIGVFTLNEDFRFFMNRNIRPLAKPKDCEYLENPPLDAALRCQVVIFDVHPKVDIKLHPKYDQIVRVKKSINRMGDLTCAVGPREKYVEYTRGTYPGLQYFPVEDYDFENEPEDLPPGGEATLEGPTLRRVSELKDVVAEKLEGLKYAGG